MSRILTWLMSFLLSISLAGCGETPAQPPEQGAPDEKDILILHGDRDGIVDLSYSQRAVETYPSAC